MKTRLSWLNKVLQILEFAGFYLFEVVASNFRVARDVLLPSSRMRPAILEVNVEGLTDQQLIALANLITMTPGTLSLDVLDDRKCLLVHSLYVDDPVSAARDIELQFRERIRRVF